MDGEFCSQKYRQIPFWVAKFDRKKPICISYMRSKTVNRLLFCLQPYHILYKIKDNGNNCLYLGPNGTYTFY